MATRAGVSVSALAHIAIIVVAIIGLGHAAQLQPETVESIAVDLVPESVASVRAGDLNSKIINAPQPAVVQDTKPAQLAQPPGNTAEDQPTPEKSNTPTPKPIVNSAPKPVPQPAPQPVVPPAPAPEPKPTPAPAPTPAPEPKPAPTPEPAPQPTEKPQPAQVPDATTPVLAATPTDATPADTVPTPLAPSTSLEQKRADFKKQQDDAAKAAADAAKQAVADAKAAADAQKQADAKAKADAAAKTAADQAKADAAAKKLAAAQQQDKAAKAAAEISNLINDASSKGATTGQGATPTLGKPTGKAAKLSQSEIGALIAQIKYCWTLMPNEIEAALSVRLLVNLNKDGSVSGMPQILETGSSEMDGSISRLAVQAIKKCAPYQLDVAKYDEWSQVDVTLNTSQ